MSHIVLQGQKIEYRLVRSKSAKIIRIKAALSGLEVVLPSERSEGEAESFLTENGKWVVEQLSRIDRYKKIQKNKVLPAGQIYFHGNLTRIHIDNEPLYRGRNKIKLGPEGFILVPSIASKTPLAKSFEYWLRRQARMEIQKLVGVLSIRLRHYPNRVLVMGQKTKWGNCSALRNLSFNWRLIMMPDYVMKYIVAHEVVHLAVPDHSQRFWITVQSICPEMSRAKAWLSTHTEDLRAPLSRYLPA